MRISKQGDRYLRRILVVGAICKFTLDRYVLGSIVLAQALISPAQIAISAMTGR
jgi:hypothetical protein